MICWVFTIYRVRHFHVLNTKFQIPYPVLIYLKGDLMTKLNKKKLNKSTIAIIFLALALVLAISFGATFALFTASSKSIGSGDVTTGYIHLTTTGSFEANTVHALPGDSLVNTAITVAPDVTAASGAEDGQYVAMRITVEGTKADGSTELTGAQLAGCLTPTVGTNWQLAKATEGATSWTLLYVYSTNSSASAANQQEIDALVATALTSSSQAVSSIVFDTEDHWQEPANASNIATTLSDNGMMAATLNITVQFKSVQVSSNTDNTFEDIYGLFA